MTTKFYIHAELWPGIAKLAEDCSEVAQVCAKIVGAGGSSTGFLGEDLKAQLEEEIADAKAAIAYVIERCNLDREAITDRFDAKTAKLEKFKNSPEPGTATTAASVRAPIPLAVEQRLTNVEQLLTSDLGRMTTLEDSLAKLDIKIGALGAAATADRQRIDRLDVALAGVQARTNFEVLQRIDKLERELGTVARAPSPQTSHREASWLYQVVNVTIDDIEGMLPSWSIVAGVAADAPASALKRHENRAALWDLMVCNPEASDIYETITAFEDAPHTVRDACAFYRAVRDKLVKFAVDLCTKTGLPPARP